MKKILKVIPNFININGYLHVDKGVPIGCLGNILEWSGQLLIALGQREEKDLIKLIVDGLEQNEVINGLIPRTKSYHIMDEDAYRWEKLSKYYWRTDVSHSQFTFLALGLNNCKNNTTANHLLSKMLIRLSIKKWSIKNIYNDDVIKNGKK